MAIANLSSLINTYCPSINIIANANSVADAQLKINTLKPEVLFLDINMPGQNGFELLKSLNYTPFVVFVTAHEKYALQAMKVCAVDFILKPIDIKELAITEMKLLQLHSLKYELKQNYGLVLRNLSNMMDKTDSVKRITLPRADGYEILEMDNIVYLSGQDNYSVFHFLKEKTKMVAKTLKDYEEMLEPFGFMRIHKSTLINLLHVKKVIQKETIDVLMADESLLAVSRRRASQLLEWTKQKYK